MTYDSRKQLPGQEFVEEVEIKLDACKYTQGDYIVFNEYFKSTNDFITPVDYTGVYGMSGIDADIVATWSGAGVVCIENEATGEIIQATITTSGQITITARAQFGSPSGPFVIGNYFITHVGETDSSCRGFPHTCSNTDSYSPTAKLSMVFATAHQSDGAIRFPGLYHGACNHEAGEVDVGESIGARARLRFRIQDQKHSDQYIVPYADKRTDNGTMFGKALARHPYFAGREVIYREGYRDAGSLDAPDFIERRFIMDDVTLSGGYFSGAALDPLILTEDKKAKMPLASPAVLSAAITGTPATFNFIDAPDYYFGAMAAVIYVRIDSEVIICSVSGAKQLTVTMRGYRSTIKDHDAGASIQDCVVFQGTHGIDAIVVALEDYTSIPAEFIDDYSAVKALLPSFILDDAIISKPQSTASFINEMIKLGNLIFYYNEVTQKIVINHIPELQAEPISINESEHIERDSVSFDQNIKNQWTRFAHMWGPVDVTKDAEENFAIRYTAINLGLEGAGRLGEVNERKAHKNMLLTTSADDSLLGIAYASRVISETENPPKIAKMKLTAKAVGNFSGGYLGPGSIINLSTSENQDKDGNALSELFQVLRIDGNGFTDFDVKMRRYQAVQPDDVDFVVSTGGINFDLSTVYAPVAGAYVVYIDVGVEFGSYDTSLPAFTTGAQASGVIFHIINRGQILGMGGVGGSAGTSGTPAANGSDGGIAFRATVDLTIDNGAGIIWAGGGGGGGQMYVSPQGPEPYYVPRAGGGGGQGFGTAVGGFNTDGSVYTTRANSGRQSAPGTYGGEWGQNGSGQDTTSGGVAGVAIDSNGYNVTITSGDNDLNIRGRRI